MNYTYSSEATNAQIYQDLVAQLALRAFDGYNASVIVYGPAQSAKGYLVFGDEETGGIVKGAAEEVFARIRADQRNQYLVTLSMLQIHKETAIDLLNPRVHENLEVKELRGFGAFVQGQCELVVRDVEEVEELLAQGDKVMAALMKRSALKGKPHFVVDLRVESQANGDMIAPVKQGVLRVVSTQGTGGMAVDTDPGLRSLSLVIEALASGREAWSVPYSGSKLTMLLQNALGGNSSTVFIATLNPIAATTHDNALALRIAERVRAISNQPVTNKSSIAATLQDLRSQIRIAREKLSLNLPGAQLHDVDARSVDHLRQLLASLERTKEQTWDARIKASQAAMEERKESLRAAGLFIVLDEELQVDGELLRKVDKERRNLVLQTYVVEQKESRLAKERQRLAELRQSAEAQGGGAAGDAGGETARLEREIGELAADTEHQRSKLEKMRINFSKYIAQVVESEERQRKVFLLPGESEQLHASREGEDWREIETVKVGDPKLRAKLKDVTTEYTAALEAIEQRYAGASAASVVAAEAAKAAEVDAASQRKQLKERLEEVRWERDQLMGRLIERDFRHQAQMTRLQKQMFLVFREYRRHFEEQRARLDARYRKLVEDAVQDALALQQRNESLELEVERLRSLLNKRADALNPAAFAVSGATAGSL